jgi:hypothetical protein
MNLHGTFNLENHSLQADKSSCCFSSKRFSLDTGQFLQTNENQNHFLAMEGLAFGLPIEEAILNPYAFETAYGHFAYVWYDKACEDVIVGTDRYGFFPIYYALENGLFIFSTSIGYVKSQLKHRSPDFEAWEEIMVLGEVLGEKTAVKQIKRLSEGTRIQIKNGKVSFYRFWSPEVPDPVDETTYIKDNNRLLEEAISLTASAPKPKVVLLSGGEDSRRLALAASRQNLDIDFYTQESVCKGRDGRWVDQDAKLAAALSEMLGYPHFIQAMANGSQYLADWEKRNVSLGFECAAHEWLLPLTRRISSPSLLYDGIVGDVTINGHYFKKFPASIDNYKDSRKLATLISSSYGQGWLDGIRQKTESSLVDRIEQLLLGYPNSPHRLTFYFIFNHARRNISCVSQLFGVHGHQTCYPFLYYPLFLQSLAIDPKLHLTKFYQRECMATLYPKIVSIPTTREAPLSDEWLINKDFETNRQINYLLTHLTASEEALEMFPKFRTKYRLLHSYRKITGGVKYFDKLSWFLSPMVRYGHFLTWLEQ